jgi:hypothetical protein
LDLLLLRADDLDGAYRPDMALDHGSCFPMGRAGSAGNTDITWNTAVSWHRTH